MLPQSLSTVFKFGTSPGAIKAWETRRNGGAGFASPNRESEMPVDRAQAKLTSGEQSRMLSVGGRIDKALGLSTSGHSVLGAWATGAENSILTRFKGASYDQIQAAMAMRGLLGEQMSVIPFRAEHGGPSRLSSFKVADTNTTALHKDLLSNGMEYHTLEPTKGGTIVHIFEEKATPDMAHTVRAYAAAHGSHAEMVSGQGKFLGSWTSRSEGRKAYEKVINSYLAKNPKARGPWKEILRGWKFGLTKMEIAMGVQL